MEILEGHNKFYVNNDQGNQVAEIVFVPTGEHLSIIEHTDVDASLKGQGWENSWWRKSWRKCAAKNVKLFLFARLPNTSLIKLASMTIFGPEICRARRVSRPLRETRDGFIVMPQGTLVVNDVIADR